MTIVAFQRDTDGQVPDPDQIARALLFELHAAEQLAGMREPQAIRADGERDMIEGGLADVAARLLGDRARETRGRAQMLRGAKAAVK